MSLCLDKTVQVCHMRKDRQIDSSSSLYQSLQGNQCTPVQSSVTCCAVFLVGQMNSFIMTEASHEAGEAICLTKPMADASLSSLK